MGCTQGKNAELLTDVKLNQQLVTSISNNKTTDSNHSRTGNNTKPDNSDSSTGSNHCVTGDSSDKEHRDNTSISAGFNTEADKLDNTFGNHNHPADNKMMMRKAKPKVVSPSAMEQEKTSTKPDTLEESIKCLNSISKDDTAEALSMIQKHGNHYDNFVFMVNMKDLIGKEPKRFFNRMNECSDISPLIDFWAFIGGAKAMAEVYTSQLKKLGVTHLTDTVLEECAVESVEDRGTWKQAIFLVSQMRHFWVNASDCSAHFAVHLAEAGLFPYLAEDIKHQDENFKSGSEVFETSVTILHNCARNKQLRQYFRDIGLVQLLTPYLSRKEKDMKLLCLLTISYIIDEEDNHLLTSDDSDFHFILEMISFAWEYDDHTTFDGYHLEELLQGVGNLAQNDENKKLLMKTEALIHLKPILSTGNDIEKQEAAKIVWELAFDKENRHLMKADAELMKLLHDLENSSDKGVAKSSTGALWVLHMDNRLKGAGLSPSPSPSFGGWQPAPPPPAPGAGKGAPSPGPPPPAKPLPTAGDQGHIMISYNWGNQKILMQIRDSLRDQGFRVWMDVDNISGSTLQAMAEAVEGASAILVCMSQRYKDSPNCRTEAEYAFALQKPIIPLLMERSYKPDGWLGILRGSKLFFDFSGKYPYEKKLDELVKELGHRGRNYSLSDEVDAPVVAEKVQPVAGSASTTKGVESWSKKDIHDWINKNHLQGCPKLQNLSGENIKFLQKLSHRAPEFYFTHLKQDLGLTALDDLMHFSDAIDQLP